MLKRKVTLKAIRQDYSKLAKQYDTRWKSFSAPAYEWVLRRLPSKSQGVLDIGCGTGRMLRLLEDSEPSLDLTGIDTCPEMLQIAEERLLRARLVIGDIEAPFLSASHYGIIISLNVLHHLNDPESFLQLLHRLCKPGGTIFLCDFATDSIPMKLADTWWRIVQPSYNRALTRKEMRSMIEKYSLRIEDEAILKPGLFWRLQIYKIAKM